MRKPVLTAVLLIGILSSGCMQLPYHGPSHGAPVYQPNADGPAATLGATAVIPDQHIAYASNQAGAPAVFGAGVARFNGVSLEAFSMDGELSATPPATPQAGFFLRPTTTVSSAGRFGYEGTSLSDTVWGDAETLVAWGRWSGTTAHVLTRGNLVTLGELYYVTGQATPVASLPQSGLATYQLRGAADGIESIASPTFRADYLSRGESRLSVLWGAGTPKVGLDFTWIDADPIGDYGVAARLQTTGGADDPSASELSVRAGTATFGGVGVPFLTFDLGGTRGGLAATCETAGACQAAVEGFFAGPAAERAGVSFQVSDAANPLFSGAWAFALEGEPATPPAGGVTPLAGTGPFGMARAGGPADLPPVLSGMNVLTQDATTGEINRFGQDAFTIEFARGTAQSADLGGDALITWGRWTNGSYEEVQVGGNNPVALGAAQALHYVIGTPTPPASIPASGTASFTLMGATNPTWGDGALAAGTLTGAMAVAWGGQFSTRVGLDLTATMPGDAAYAVVTQGGLANPSQSQVQIGFLSYFSGTVPVSSAGNACAANPGGCSAVINGLFAGPNAERAGIAYRIGSGDAQQSLYGAAAFRR